MRLARFFPGCRILESLDSGGFRLQARISPPSVWGCRPFSGLLLARFSRHPAPKNKPQRITEVPSIRELFENPWITQPPENPLKVPGVPSTRDYEQSENTCSAQPPKVPSESLTVPTQAHPAHPESWKTSGLAYAAWHPSVFTAPR